MYDRKTICFLLISFILLNSISANGQTFLRDDFKFKSNNWFWRADGNQSIPSVQNGLLHLQLLNAVDSQYCNTEIYNPNQPYLPGTQVRIRLKGSPQHIGSRGWGFWDGSLSSVYTDYDVAWVMQQSSELPDNVYNWFLFGVDGNLLLNKQTIDLTATVDETDWNTYHIIWRADSTFLYVNDTQLFVATINLPDEKMRVDLWIDNRVINIDAPLQYWNNNSEGSEMFVDFIEVFGMDGQSIERSCFDSILLWDSPNTFPDGNTKVLWKNYNITTLTEGEALIFITGDAESYGAQENDDDLKIELDSTDYGWNTDNSLNGTELNGSGASIALQVSLDKGDHNLKLFSDNTPFLRDAIVLFHENGEVVLNNSYNDIAEEIDSLYESITFNSARENNTVFLISGTGFEGDKIRVEIDDMDYSYTGDNAIIGNELMGTPKTIVISKNLSVGSHSIKVYKNGSPTIYNIASYSVPLTEINIKVFLEGCYIAPNKMVSIIAQSDNIPKLQPFNRSPWNYKGMEEIVTFPDNIIDWVLIELRDKKSDPTKKYLQAALLRNDGIITNTKGESIKLLGIAAGYYYLTVYHRNHLAIISSESLLIP